MKKLPHDDYTGTSAAVSRALDNWPFPDDEFEVQAGVQRLYAWIIEYVVPVTRWINGTLLRSLVFPEGTLPRFHVVEALDDPWLLRRLREEQGYVPPPKREPPVRECQSTLLAVWLFTAPVPIDLPSKADVATWLQEVAGEIEAHPRRAALGIRDALEWLRDGLPAYASALRKAQARRPDAEVSNQIARVGELVRESLSREQAPKKKRRRKRRPPLDKDIRPLTDRQTEVVQIVGECKGNFAEAARRMCLNRKTVKEHYDTAMAKLGLAGVRNPAKQLKPKTQRLPEDRRGQVNISGE